MATYDINELRKMAQQRAKQKSSANVNEPQAQEQKQDVQPQAAPAQNAGEMTKEQQAAKNYIQMYKIPESASHGFRKDLVSKEEEGKPVGRYYVPDDKRVKYSDIANNPDLAKEWYNELSPIEKANILRGTEPMTEAKKIKYDPFYTSDIRGEMKRYENDDPYGHGVEEWLDFQLGQKDYNKTLIAAAQEVLPKEFLDEDMDETDILTEVWDRRNDKDFMEKLIDTYEAQARRNVPISSYKKKVNKINQEAHEEKLAEENKQDK